MESAADGRYTGGATPTPTPGKKRYSLKFSPAHVSTSNSFRSELGINDLVINTNPAFGSSIATFSPKMGYHPPGSEVDRRRAGSQRMLPISPVGRGDIDPLVLAPPPTSSIADLEDSEDFLRIRDGFKLAQISLQHAIREERLIRDLMLSSIQQWGQSHREVDGSVAVLEAQVSALTAPNKDMHDSLVLLRRKEQDAVACVAELEKKLSGLKTELFDMTTREGSAKGLLDEFERQRAFVGLQLASAREEKDRLHQQCAAMSQAHRSLELKLDEIFEEKSLLESRADLLEQDLCVLQAERDELVKRFIPLSNAKTQFDRGSKFL